MAILGCVNFHDFCSISFICTTRRASSIVKGLATLMDSESELWRFEFCAMSVMGYGMTKLEEPDEINTFEKFIIFPVVDVCLFLRLIVRE
jgi:hypothetical protein